MILKKVITLSIKHYFYSRIFIDILYSGYYMYIFKLLYLFSNISESQKIFHDIKWTNDRNNSGKESDQQWHI